MIQPLNYCRQITRSFRGILDAAANGRPVHWGKACKPSQQIAFMEYVLDFINAAQKFILPFNGILIDSDHDHRGLDENDQLHLPFKHIALEYQRKLNTEVGGGTQSTKSVVLAREIPHEGPAPSNAIKLGIAVLPIFWLDAISRWAPLPEIALPSDQYLDRADMMDGLPVIKVAVTELTKDLNISPTDYLDELRTLLRFLSALSCFNVSIDRIEPKSNAKTKDGLPFDAYHILMVKSHHGISDTGLSFKNRHSPREHLRRGHIRRYPKKKLWINATIVNADRGFGKISKDYGFQNRERI